MPLAFGLFLHVLTPVAFALFSTSAISPTHKSSHAVQSVHWGVCATLTYLDMKVCLCVFVSGVLFISYSLISSFLCGLPMGAQ